MPVVDGTDGPADDEPRVEVENRRQVEPAAAPDDELGGVTDPPLVRRGRDKLLPEQIRSDGLVVITHCRALESLPCARRQALGLFQANHPLPAHAMPLRLQIPVQPRTAIRAATRLMRSTDQHAELVVLLRVRRGRPPHPRIEPAPRDVKQLTEVRDRHGGLLRLDERELGLIRFRGRSLKGDYDVHDGDSNEWPATTPAV